MLIDNIDFIVAQMELTGENHQPIIIFFFVVVLSYENPEAIDCVRYKGACEEYET